MKTIQKFPSWFSKKKLSGKVAIGLASLFVLCCLCSVPIAILSLSTPTPKVQNTSIAQVEPSPISDQTESATEVPTIAPTDTPEPTNTPLPPTATQNPNLIKPGTYIVGTDIQPGIYKGIARESLISSCYWERLKDLTGSLYSILANSNSVGQFYVEVKDSDFALTTACQLTRLETIPEHTGEYPQLIEPGTYLVGSDIQPGTYRGQAGGDFSNSCYWERLRSVTGDLYSILANDNAIGQFYVQVLPSDFALNTACELEWVGE